MTDLINALEDLSLDLDTGEQLLALARTISAPETDPRERFDARSNLAIHLLQLTKTGGAVELGLSIHQDCLDDPTSTIGDIYRTEGLIAGFFATRPQALEESLEAGALGVALRDGTDDDVRAAWHEITEQTLDRGLGQGLGVRGLNAARDLVSLLRSDLPALLLRETIAMEKTGSKLGAVARLSLAEWTFHRRPQESSELLRAVLSDAAVEPDMRFHAREMLSEILADPYPSDALNLLSDASDDTRSSSRARRILLSAPIIAASDPSSAVTLLEELLSEPLGTKYRQETTYLLAEILTVLDPRRAQELIDGIDRPDPAEQFVNEMVTSQDDGRLNNLKSTLQVSIKNDLQQIADDATSPADRNRIRFERADNFGDLLHEFPNTTSYERLALRWLLDVVQDSRSSSEDRARARWDAAMLTIDSPFRDEEAARPLYWNIETGDAVGKRLVHSRDALAFILAIGPDDYSKGFSPEPGIFIPSRHAHREPEHLSAAQLYLLNSEDENEDPERRRICLSKAAMELAKGGADDEALRVCREILELDEANEELITFAQGLIRRIEGDL